MASADVPSLNHGVSGSGPSLSSGSLDRDRDRDRDKGYGSLRPHELPYPKQVNH